MRPIEAAALQYMVARGKEFSTATRLAEANAEHVFGTGPDPVDLRRAWEKARVGVMDAYNFLKDQVTEGNYEKKYVDLAKKEEGEAAKFHCGYPARESTECNGGPSGHQCVGAVCGYEAADQARRQCERAETTNRQKKRR